MHSHARTGNAARITHSNSSHSSHFEHLESRLMLSGAPASPDALMTDLADQSASLVTAAVTVAAEPGETASSAPGPGWGGGDAGVWSASAKIKVTDSSGAAHDARIQFTTDRSTYNPRATDSTLVRPAYPDEKQYVDVTNEGLGALRISEIRVNADDVTVLDAPSDDIVLMVGESRRFQVIYAPTTPTIANRTVQDFDIADGLVIVSNASNGGLFEIALKGASTFNADITYDGKVDLSELGPTHAQFGKNRWADRDFDPTRDINGDGAVDLCDLGPLNAEFGRRGPAPGPVVSATTAMAACGALPATMPSRHTRSANTSPQRRIARPTRPPPRPTNRPPSTRPWTSPPATASSPPPPRPTRRA